MSGAVRRAERQDAATAAAALASAFAEDPVFHWVVGRQPGETRLRPFFRSIVDVVLRREDGELHLSQDGRAAALWFPPQRWALSPAEQLRGLPGAVRALRGGTRRGLALDAALHRQHPTEPHEYLNFLGTATGARSTGLGSALLADMTARLDRDGVPAYLESSNPRNVPLYERHGFRTRGRLDVPDGCPPLLPMWRDPA